MPAMTEEAVNRKIKLLSNSLLALQIRKKRVGIRGTLRFKRDYPELDKHALDHEIVLVDKVLRWKQDPVVRHLMDTQVDLNRLWEEFYNDKCKFGALDLMKFYRDLGYSLGGYLDVWHSKYDFDTETVKPLSEW